MYLEDNDDGTFDFLGDPLVDGSTFIPVSAPAPPSSSPPSVQPIPDVFDAFQVSTWLPVESTRFAPDNFVAPVSPPAPETFFLPRPTPLDVINIGTRTDPTYIPRSASDDRSLDEIFGSGDTGERSPSLIVAPLPQRVGAPIFRSLTDLATVSSSSSSPARSSVLPLVAIAAAVLLFLD